MVAARTRQSAQGSSPDGRTIQRSRCEPLFARSCSGLAMTDEIKPRRACRILLADDDEVTQVCSARRHSIQESSPSLAGSQIQRPFPNVGFLRPSCRCSAIPRVVPFNMVGRKVFRRFASTWRKRCRAAAPQLTSSRCLSRVARSKLSCWLSGRARAPVIA